LKAQVSGPNSFAGEDGSLAPALVSSHDRLLPPAPELPLGANFTIDQSYDELKQKMPFYEHRQEQIELSRLIERAIASGKTGVFEAGTGIGKSLGALIPAALSGKRVVVSTATISLQDQYISKEIPLLRQLLPRQIQVALLKGRGNYIGIRRWQDHLKEQTADDDFADWVNTTETGDISELEFVPPYEMWTEINSDSDDCLRNKCPQFANCFFFNSRRQAEKADIIVVNHALLLADAASRGAILPEYEVLIVDEAHHLNAIATDAFSVALTSRGIRRMATRALKRVNAPVPLVEEVEQSAHELFHYLNSELRYQRMRIHRAVPEAQDLTDALQNLRKWLSDQTFENILDVDQAQEKAKLKAKAIITNIDTYLHCLSLLMDPQPDWVTWVERQDSTAARMSITSAPLDVSEYISDLLLNKDGLESANFMSATLATSGEDPFRFFKVESGITGKVVQEKFLSAFDYEKQSILYLPKLMPEPNSPDFLGVAAEEIEKIIEITQGRAFVLFTSKYALNTTFEAVAQRLPYDARRQGDLSRQKLIEWFKSTPNAVLFGTSSFWEGVSVDGEQLSCVIIDRIPFQVPDDPVHEARCDQLKQNTERSWFNDLALPHAITRLKQGVGRLIRTQTDYGMVAILDPRLTKKPYGRKILDCLPPMQQTNNLRDVENFFGSIPKNEQLRLFDF
jgi:ATP-dependent DNA helicase DinG